MKKAVFLDRDGTINNEVDYLSSISDILIFDGVISSLKKLKDQGFLNLIITNQSGIARGYFTESDLQSIHEEFNKQLNHQGTALIDEFFYSPYHVDGIIKEYTKECNTRKPGTGMIEQAVKKYNVDIENSFFIGDSLVDMQCALNAGLKKILVKTGYGLQTFEQCKEKNIFIDCFADTFQDAVNFIISQNKQN